MGATNATCASACCKRGAAADDCVADVLGNFSLEILVFLLQSHLECFDFRESLFELLRARGDSGFELGVGAFELTLERPPRDVRLDAREYFLVLERLGDIVIGPRCEGPHLVLTFRQRSHEDHGNLRERRDAAYASCRLEAVDAGHHGIHEHQAWRCVARLLESAVAVGRDAHAITRLR